MEKIFMVKSKNKTFRKSFIKNASQRKGKLKLKYIGVVVVLAFLAGTYLASATTVITDIQMIIGNVTIGPDEIQVGNTTIGESINSSRKVVGKSGLEVMVPKGAIIMWSGTIDGNGNPVVDGTPDTNWQICDGTGGTSDLRGRFIVGSGGSYAVNDTGGENAHVLSISEMPSHRHYYSGYTSTSGNHRHPIAYPNDWRTNTADRGSRDRHIVDPDGGGGLYTGYAGSHSHYYSGYTRYQGGNAAHENRPPYYALAYIMRVQ